MSDTAKTRAQLFEAVPVREHPTREDLILSPECWKVTIAHRLWMLNGQRKFNKWEKLAEKIVDRRFMELITEVSQLKKEIGT